MLNSVLTVAEKVAVLFIMIGVGYACSKFRVITQRGAAQITTVLLYIVTPCVIISSLQHTVKGVNAQTLLAAGGLAVLAHVLGIAISLLLFRSREDRRKRVLRFATVYSNCGFMGLPVVQAVLGSEGVVYVSMYIAVFNLFSWTHGLSMMSGGNKASVKKLLLNPGVIGLVVGLPLFFCSVHLPDIVLSPLNSFSDLNTPLAMLVIGGHIAKVNFRELFSDKDVYKIVFYRLIFIPALFFGIMLLLKPDTMVLQACVIVCSAPTGATVALFAAQYGGDVKLASKAVAVTTLFSVVTMPVFAALAKMIT